jgi:transposase
VLEATSGLEVRVAAVNPRQTRDFARAKGCLTKADRVDTIVLVAFARCIRLEARSDKDEESRAGRIARLAAPRWSIAASKRRYSSMRQSPSR